MKFKVTLKELTKLPFVEENEKKLLRVFLDEFELEGEPVIECKHENSNERTLFCGDCAMGEKPKKIEKIKGFELMKLDYVDTIHVKMLNKINEIIKHINELDSKE